jgi:beta-glucanase (GH16 family)
MATGNIIPPVRSARLNTKGKKSIKYGRVEVVARMGSGDWLWPAICELHTLCWVSISDPILGMMPENDLYGQWPQSGEIDIMESRGNSYTYPTGGNDALTSTIHWGPTPKTDSFWLTTDGLKLRRSDLTKDFHTFGLEWSENYLFTYLDNRLSQVLYVNFKREDMWTRGGFAQRTENSTLLANPWAISGEKNTPFDQEFFLILNVAVGSRNGWFPDGVGSKPWADAAPAAAADFYKGMCLLFT